MPKKFALKDVDPIAITLCKEGANRQRIFLRKSAGVKTEDLLTLGGRHPLLKNADWSALYCVVAEPGAEELPGQVGDPDSVDVWDEDEIRKAAHRLLKNKAYVNAMHDAFAEEGCTIVENAVALADLPVDSPDGETQVIKKGSWYVAIEPNEDMKAKVDAGDIESISLEGSGTRVLLEKSTAPRGRRLQVSGGQVTIAKAATFAEVIGERELTDSLWQAWRALEDVIYGAFRDEEETDPQGVIKVSLDEFNAYLTGKLDQVKPAVNSLAKEIATFDGTTYEEESEMGLSEDLAALKKSTDEKFEEITGTVKKSNDATVAAVEGLVGLTEKLVERVENGGSSEEGDGDEPKSKKNVKKVKDVDAAVEAIGELADTMDELDTKLTSLAKSVSKLGEGSSSQERDEEDRIRKERKDNPLAGLLS